MTARFAKVPLGLLDWWASARLTASESAVLVYLLRQTAGEMRDTTDRWAGAAMIRQATGLADASISRALVSLRARRVIEVVRSHGIDTATVYRLTPPPERTPSPQRWGDPPLSRGGTDQRYLRERIRIQLLSIAREGWRLMDHLRPASRPLPTTATCRRSSRSSRGP